MLRCRVAVVAFMTFSLKSGTVFCWLFFLGLSCAHMHMYVLMLKVVSIRICFLMVVTDYSKSLFILNTFKSSHKSFDIKANSSCVI